MAGTLFTAYRRRSAWTGQIFGLSYMRTGSPMQPSPWNTSFYLFLKIASLSVSFWMVLTSSAELQNWITLWIAAEGVHCLNHTGFGGLSANCIPSMTWMGSVRLRPFLQLSKWSMSLGCRCTCSLWMCLAPGVDAPAV